MEIRCTALSRNASIAKNNKGKLSNCTKEESVGLNPHMLTELSFLELIWFSFSEFLNFKTKTERLPSVIKLTQAHATLFYHTSAMFMYAPNVTNIRLALQRRRRLL